MEEEECDDDNNDKVNKDDEVDQDDEVDKDDVDNKEEDMDKEDKFFLQIFLKWPNIPACQIL